MASTLSISPLTEDERAAVERGTVLAMNVQVRRAHIRSNAEEVAKMVGVKAFVAAWNSDLNAILENLRRAGLDMEGWQ